ncbi:MAG: sensor histidine kinase [Defluviitaleaceae bacterium]|nr:sensor histidine kinase [Defluviitaleaceae bacterium]
MKSFRWIYVKYSMLMCFTVALLSFIIFLVSVHPFVPVQEMIETFLLVIGLSLSIGATVGISISLYINKPLHQMSHFLSEVERGNTPHLPTDRMFKEFKALETSIVNLSEKTAEQSLMMQRKTNEYAEEKQHIEEAAVAVERGRLARELHDSVSQQLFAMSMMSAALHAGMPDEEPLKANMAKLEHMAVQAQSEMRALLLHLRPIQLEGKQLVVGIRELLTELSAKQNLDVRWQLDDLAFERGVEDHLFRILQEAISNTLRHAKASKLEISLKRSDPLAMMRIFDNGIGFNKDDRKVGSYGLESMKERAEEIGGTLKIMSLKGTGTQIEIKIPLKR